MIDHYEMLNSLLYKKLDLNVISKGRKHLDFGCGKGEFAGMLARKYPNLEVTGIDASKESIAEAIKIHLPNLKFICSKKITGFYDSINVFSVLHELIGRLNEYLKEFYEHLNKNGVIIIFDYQKTSREEYKSLYEMKKHLPWIKGFDEDYAEHNKWTRKQFQKLIEHIGFKTVKNITIRKYKFLYIGKK